ncbi:hypothetical protein OCB72_30055 [Bacillus cereus]|nr:hypothetical protein [Bacillus cereus]
MIKETLLKKFIGWMNKEMDVNQIVEKLPLDIYLQKGLEVLRIR